MTKEELKAKIDLCVAQQGNQSGLAGLAEILNAVIDLIPELPETPIASATKLGCVKIGEGLAVAEDGTISVMQSENE